MTVHWTATEDAHPARDAARRRWPRWRRRTRTAGSRFFAPDAVVADPIGPSFVDPSGEGHLGVTAIGAFWECAIGLAERTDFTVTDSFACGSEVANVGVITTTLPGGAALDAEGVFTYRVDEAGRIVALRQPSGQP